MDKIGLFSMRASSEVFESLTMQMPQHIVRADDADEVRMLIDNVERMHIQRQQLLDDRLDRRVRRSLAGSVSDGKVTVAYAAGSLALEPRIT